MNIIVVKNYDEMSKKAANIIASHIILKSNSILGLATGSTPVGTYKELIKLYQNGDIDFTNVTTFNLDEYYGLSKENSQSYHYYMHENLFNHINVKEANIHIPNGTTNDIKKECIEYDNEIEKAGGIDLQLLGIGRNGHIGFNEPDSMFEKSTHLVQLNEDTIRANSRFFDSIDEVPTKAVSMGIKTIMKAKRILLLANGANKAEAIYKTVKGEITPKVPASVLQLHPDVTIIVDEEAAKKL